MRVVVDTNIVVSGLIWHGPPLAVLDAARNSRLSLFTSPALLAELHDVLGRSKFATLLANASTTPERLLDSYTSIVTIIDPAVIPPVVAIDPNDDEVLACAVAAQAEAIVSGDRHLRDLQRYRGIPILTALDLLVLIVRPT